ncbi:MAG: hypothetical protein A3F83_05315 [Candidatus Glassbacteria bacterium RIFCSPLOWO2_12_FULL_58_11]|uniref:YbbR domain pair protein n=1 Tax=Candidatus Glassbacteria bacterium RIFCSPLOWO2_12_FULL_58_11 TaxID=1817867 RepID=A0A1F5YQ52_9BACT|nr:MAG: hypothetical protein A3F83_05315 [Candidatus Glassbacteria bacterium RIFCSPLOWO2_12_FULL_58_11]
MNLHKNLPLKFISLVIAIFLWYMVTGKDYRYGDFNIPLELRGLTESLILTKTTADNQEVNKVTVRIRATETVIRALGERTMFLRLDISHLGEGHHTVQISDEMVMGRPPGAEVAEIFPRVLELDVEPLLIRPFVMVNPEILGKPAGDFDISLIRCDPPSVSVRGPKNLVEKIEKISTPQVNVDGMTATTIERSLTLVPTNPLVLLVPDKVDLRIVIGEKAFSRSFQQVPVEVKNARYEYRINPRHISVWVTGPLSQVEKLTEKNLHPVVTLTGQEPAAKNIRLDLQLICAPQDSFPGVRLERFSQNYVDVFLTHRKLEP